MENFDALRALAAIDRSVAQLRHERESLPVIGEMRDVDATLQSLVVELRTLEEERNPIVAVRDSLHEQALALSQRRTEISERLAHSTAGARELDAMAHEVTHLGEAIDELETKELEALELLEPLDVRFHEIGQAAKIATERRVELVAMVAEGQAHIDREIELALEPRSEALALVPAAVASTYERILARVHDVAAVDLIDGKCAGCKIAVVALDLGRWKASTPENPSSCPECSRLWIGPA